MQFLLIIILQISEIISGNINTWDILLDYDVNGNVLKFSWFFSIDNGLIENNYVYIWFPYNIHVLKQSEVMIQIWSSNSEQLYISENGVGAGLPPGSNTNDYYFLI